MSRLTYEERLRMTKNPVLKKLFGIMIEKRTNLCIAANFKTIEETVQFIDKVGKHICILKIQSERMGGGVENALTLAAKKQEYNFLIFEDRKFGNDTRETVQSQYAGSYVKYADLITVLPREKFIQAIEAAAKEANLSESRGCLVLCETSFEDEVIASGPQKSLELAQSHRICAGIIAQKLQVSGDIIKLTPGVHINLTNDGFDQRWRHPSDAIADGADVVIVGRGIVSAPDEEHEKVTCQYKDAAWQAYCEQIK